MPGNELIGDVVEIVADDHRLRADTQDIIAHPLDQSRLPSGRHGAESVPSMARDQTELRGLGSEFFLDVVVGLGRRLMVLRAIGAEPSLEEVDDAAMRELTRLNLEQIVRKREEPETRFTQLAQRRGDLGMGWHG